MSTLVQLDFQAISLYATEVTAAPGCLQNDFSMYWHWLPRHNSYISPDNEMT